MGSDSSKPEGMATPWLQRPARASFSGLWASIKDGLRPASEHPGGSVIPWNVGLLSPSKDYCPSS